MATKYKKTGVFATKKEVARIVAKANDPLIWIGNWALVKNTVQGVVHSLALKHGLPEIPGYYGINTETREFLKV